MKSNSLTTALIQAYVNTKQAKSLYQAMLIFNQHKQKWINNHGVIHYQQWDDCATAAFTMFMITPQQTNLL